ncbi:MAG: M48 family metalloprotease, partial [Planctomycetota bacterium]|nr:M48 family metalloprotease [Planctomycetota bacterium]
MRQRTRLASLAAAILCVLLSAFAVVPITSCQINPVTGESQFIIIDDQQEISLGEGVAVDVEGQYGGVYRDASVVTYVQDVGGRVAAQSERQTVPYRFSVVNSDQINAFALPGGRIYVTTGLLQRMSNEAQLAAVLGHEIGHVAARHSAVALSRAIGVGLLAQVATSLATGGDEDSGDAETISAVVGVVYGLISNGFSRQDEYQADNLGLRYMHKAGYNPLAMAQVMQIIQEEGGDASALEEFLSTHPSSGKRIDEIEREIRTAYPDVDSNTRLTFGEDRFLSATASLRGGMTPAPRDLRTAQPGRVGPGTGLRDSTPPRDEPETDVESLFQQAEEARQAGRNEEAVKLYTQLISADGAKIQYYIARGLASLELQNFTASESDFKQALRIDRNSYEARIGLGALYLQKRDLNRARDTLKEATNSSPTQAIGHLLLARTYLALNNKA